MVTQKLHRSQPVCLLLLAAAVLFCPTAQAADYKELKCDTSLKRNMFAINQALRAGRFSETTSEGDFKKFFLDFYLPQWTLTKDLGRLPKNRQDLNTKLKQATGQAHDALVQLVLKFMTDLIADNYHPAVQLNAMLAVGDLNSVETPPTPLPEALEPLLAVVEDSQKPDALRVAALIGLQRHVVAKLPNDDVRKRVVAVLLKQADQLASADQAGRHWILAQVIEILGQLGTPGDDNAVYQAIFKTASNSKLPIVTRATAIEALGHLDFTGAQGVDFEEPAVAVARFVVDACDEVARLAKQSGYSPVESHRWLRPCLEAARLALNGADASHKGLASLAQPPAQRSRLEQLQKCIAPAIAFLDAKDHEQEPLDPTLATLRDAVNAWLKQK
ncbi:MAG: hypothetical protein ABFC77_13765 [Thermoguttaceae bacterium]